MTKETRIIKVAVNSQNKPTGLVVSGEKIFHARDRHGVPFDILFDQVINIQKNVIDWIEFVNTALQANWTAKKIITDIEYGLRDAGIEESHQNMILERIKCFLMNTLKNDRRN